ncbi:MAG: protein translocase subunit SecD [Proteocatella sp.]
MKNTKSKFIFFLITIIIALCAYTAFLGIDAGGIKVNSTVSNIKQGLDLKGGVFMLYEAETDMTGQELDDLMDQTIAVFRKRIDGMGLTEPVIVREGEKRIRIELPGVKDAQQAINAIGKTAQLQFVTVEGDVLVTGADVKDAKVAINSKDNQPVVSLQFTPEGAQKFADASAKLAGTGQPLVIVLDNEVISSPTISTAITGGSAQIEGNFTVDSASELANLIRGGALPVNFTEVQSSIVSATLGVDALNKSIMGALIGIALVMLFMIVYYKLPGFVATIALTSYMVIVAYVYQLIGVTLTLPGIAALILSVGMAVDANVIIFERIKEEIINGKSIRVSIDSGFKKALSTILDSQITTFIAGIVLYYFGTGQIKGFAITLMIGIIVSMFTALTITKLILKNLVNGFGINDKKYFGVKEA